MNSVTKLRLGIAAGVHLLSLTGNEVKSKPVVWALRQKILAGTRLALFQGRLGMWPKKTKGSCKSRPRVQDRPKTGRPT
jgi:hypothetical protein